LAYKIEKHYYNNIHYVWCTTEFNSHNQPPTSNPATICKRYLEQITTGDRHAKEIDNNIAGILRGAKVKRDSGLITEREYDEIRSIVSVAEYEAFLPIVYIVNNRKVKDRCIRVKEVDRSSDDAVEYRVEDLSVNEFETIAFKDLLDGILSIPDKKVGE
jgi:hypothetical protein